MAALEVPLIAHVIFRLDVGGLENGLVNLINHIPPDRYRHAIICIDSFTDFRRRIERDDVEVIAINKKPGTDWSAYWKLFKIIRELRPAILHTRNIAALDALLPAKIAGVKHRIHGEHGWDVNDLKGENKRLRLLRRIHAPLVSEYVALSRDLENYLIKKVGIRRKKIRQIYNGVDVDKFCPTMDRVAVRNDLIPDFPDNAIVIGTVGRIQPVKDQANLAHAFIRLIGRSPELAERARLAIIGDGEARDSVERPLRDAGVSHLCWMPGRRNDISEILQCLDIFVLPSLAEGISNTLLEAMACALPVVATDVGGNPEIVLSGETGYIVPPGCRESITSALATYVRDDELRASHGMAGRYRVEREFSIGVMVRRYLELYDKATR